MKFLALAAALAFFYALSRKFSFQIMGTMGNTLGDKHMMNMGIDNQKDQHDD